MHSLVASPGSPHLGCFITGRNHNRTDEPSLRFDIHHSIKTMTDSAIASPSLSVTDETRPLHQLRIWCLVDREFLHRQWLRRIIEGSSGRGSLSGFSFPSSLDNFAGVCAYTTLNSTLLECLTSGRSTPVARANRARAFDESLRRILLLSVADSGFVH